MTRRAPESLGYRRYVVVMLMLIYLLNFVDRQIVGVLGQPLKQALHLEDWQVGALAGLGFAVLYSTLGIPIARMADRSSRTWIVTIATAIWSLMTMICGAANNFGQLLAARVGVGIGEAGCVAPSHSLISDSFPPSQRATALGVFSLGIPLGVLAGALAASTISQNFGWRIAFAAVGAPGLLLALIFRLTVREPVRGRYDGRPDVIMAQPPMAAIVRHFLRVRTLFHVTAGGTLAAFAGYALNAFGVQFLQRGFPLTLVEAATGYALVAGVGAGIGTALGGVVTDWAGKRGVRYHVLIPAIGLLLAGPLYMLALVQTDLGAMAALVVIPSILQYLYLGPGFGLIQNLVAPPMRASAAAIFTFTSNVVGLGLGPLLVGIGSDFLARRWFAGSGPFAVACPSGAAPLDATAALVDFCRAAAFSGLQWAMVAAATVHIWAGVHFLLASRAVARDLAAKS